MIKEMLLIENFEVLKLSKEFMDISKMFIFPFFLISVGSQFFGNLNFYEVLKKTLIIFLFLGSFTIFHKKAVEISFITSEKILKSVSPNNFFLKPVFTRKVRHSAKNKKLTFLDQYLIPDLNDLFATGLYILSKLFLIIIKLIFSTVYHFTYLFSGFCAILYFFSITEASLIGCIKSSIWCILYPFVLITLFALVSNTITTATANNEIMDLNSLIWVFGVTLLIFVSPMITMNLLRGEGVSNAGSELSKLTLKVASNVYGKIPSRFKI